MLVHQEDPAHRSGLFKSSEEDTVDELIKEIDKDGDGYITWTDFESYIRGK